MQIHHHIIQKQLIVTESYIIERERERERERETDLNRHNS